MSHLKKKNLQHFRIVCHSFSPSVVKFVGNKNSRVVESEKTNNNGKDDKRGVEKCNEKINIRDENNAACVEQSPKKILTSSR